MRHEATRRVEPKSAEARQIAAKSLTTGDYDKNGFADLVVSGLSVGDEPGYGRSTYLSGNADGLTYELLVVDNGTPAETEAALARVGAGLPLRLFVEPTRGKNRALNRAIPEARGALFVFTDDDVMVDPDWLLELVAGARRWPEHQVFGGRPIGEVDGFGSGGRDDDAAKACERFACRPARGHLHRHRSRDLRGQRTACRNQYRARLRIVLSERGGRRNATAAGELQVHQDDGGAVLPVGRQCVFATVRLGHDADVVGEFERGHESAAHDKMVVDDQDGQGGGFGHRIEKWATRSGSALTPRSGPGPAAACGVRAPRDPRRAHSPGASSRLGAAAA